MRQTTSGYSVSLWRRGLPTLRTRWPTWAGRPPADQHAYYSSLPRTGDNRMSRIAFIGLGHMGGPMAMNLLKAGHELVVFDLVPAALKVAADAGATIAASAQEAVKGVDAVVSMLPASKHVEGLYLGDAALLDHIAPGTLVLECSTIAPESARKVA